MAAPIMNFNIGVVGHVDSGKTSLSKVLSTTASTASFDKSPQSQERGITIDLGFSSFFVDAPNHVKTFGYETLQFTLVDCPGHASLIRTIIGGSQIIDMMLLVVDVMKGMQTQTAECLVLGEITTKKMVVVLNKIDLLPPDKRSEMVEKMRKKMLKTLEKTKFVGCPIVAIAARPGGLEEDETTKAIGIQELIGVLCEATYLPKRNSEGPFVFAVDHCFSVRGQGTVMTGTVVSGSVAVGNNVEVPAIKETRKVKSIQMFKKPVTSASQGDRVGICVTQFDSKLIERGLVCSPGLTPTIYASIAVVKPIRFFKGSINSKSKFHISIGHNTVMASCYFFTSELVIVDDDDDTFDWNREYVHCDELGRNGDSNEQQKRSFVLLEFEKPVTASKSCLIIGSRLDTDIHQNTCRLAFEGRLLYGMEEKTYLQTLLPRLRIYKTKRKEGVVERLVDEYSLIGRSLFKKETTIDSFVGMKVRLSSGETGVIEGSFGQSGKVKIRIPEGLSCSTVSLLKKVKKKAKETVSVDAAVRDFESHDPISIFLTFKRYVFDSKKRLVQT